MTIPSVSRYGVLSLLSTVLAVVVIPFQFAYGASCCGTKSIGGPRVGAFTGSVMKVDDFLLDPHLDTLEYRLSTYGYYANSWSGDGHSGDPLGTGGKWPLAYSMELFREQAVETPALLKRDMREQYVDFGYIPLWRANTLAMAAKYRLSPELNANIQLVYGGDPGKPGANANGALGVGEVSLLWVPLFTPHFWLRAGNILDAGTYSSLFDQNPLENFLFTGLLASFAKDIGDEVQSVTSVAFGGSFLNSMILRDPGFDSYTHPGYLDAQRQRTYLYAKSSLLINRDVGIKVLGGIQTSPADSSPDVIGTMYHYAAGKGIMGGLEGTWFGKKTSHTMMITLASGDAMLGFGSPDYVIKPTGAGPIDPVNLSASQYTFTKDGSRCLNAVYWTGFESGAFHLQAGVWYNARFPSKTSTAIINPEDSLVRSQLPSTALRDTIVTLTPENFSALKVSLLPSLQIGLLPLFFGVRFDNITYLTPNAHTNMLELERDQTLRPVTYPGVTGPVYGPSEWDREAVNVNIISPTLRLDFKDIGGITGTYALGLYDKPVDRQGSLSKVHGNFTIAADFLIIIKKIKGIRP